MKRMLSFVFSIAILLFFGQSCSVPNEESEPTTDEYQPPPVTLWDSKEKQQFDNCAVYYSVDPFTDEKSLGLSCESRSSAVVSIALYGSGVSTIRLSPSNKLNHFEKRVSVRYRIDNGKAKGANTMWNQESNSAFMGLSNLNNTLEEIARGGQIIFEVGSERDDIFLDGSMEAVDEFRKRSAYRLENTQRFENCSVNDSKNPLTDKVQIELYCWEPLSKRFGVSCGVC